ncbi:diacylglycerol O-acyltransferase 1 [Entomophthora muscae]|uniref:Diacylglycerol O-acyltransferase 1 n=1 Tax=Entomophthora muscae TaxID=34485 RepID=A0ACC2RPG8_9FUNG|nr:diacylglycerol O-acyltransferase 1 [Entomophthora muscae]
MFFKNAREKLKEKRPAVITKALHFAGSVLVPVSAGIPNFPSTTKPVEPKPPTKPVQVSDDKDSGHCKDASPRQAPIFIASAEIPSLLAKLEASTPFFEIPYSEAQGDSKSYTAEEVASPIDQPRSCKADESGTESPASLVSPRIGSPNCEIADVTPDCEAFTKAICNPEDTEAEIPVCEAFSKPKAFICGQEVPETGPPSSNASPKSEAQEYRSVESEGKPISPNTYPKYEYQMYEHEEYFEASPIIEAVACEPESVVSKYLAHEPELHSSKSSSMFSSESSPNNESPICGLIEIEAQTVRYEESPIMVAQVYESPDTPSSQISPIIEAQVCEPNEPEPSTPASEVNPICELEDPGFDSSTSKPSPIIEAKVYETQELGHVLLYYEDPSKVEARICDSEGSEAQTPAYETSPMIEESDTNPHSSEASPLVETLICEPKEQEVETSSESSPKIKTLMCESEEKEGETPASKTLSRFASPVFVPNCKTPASEGSPNIEDMFCEQEEPEAETHVDDSLDRIESSIYESRYSTSEASLNIQSPTFGCQNSVYKHLTSEASPKAETSIRETEEEEAETLASPTTEVQACENRGHEASCEISPNVVGLSEAETPASEAAAEIEDFVCDPGTDPLNCKGFSKAVSPGCYSEELEISTPSQISSKPASLVYNTQIETPAPAAYSDCESPSPECGSSEESLKLESNGSVYESKTCASEESIAPEFGTPEIPALRCESHLTPIQAYHDSVENVSVPPTIVEPESLETFLDDLPIMDVSNLFRSLVSPFIPSLALKATSLHKLPDIMPFEKTSDGLFEEPSCLSPPESPPQHVPSYTEVVSFEDLSAMIQSQYTEDFFVAETLMEELAIGSLNVVGDVAVPAEDSSSDEEIDIPMGQANEDSPVAETPIEERAVADSNVETVEASMEGSLSNDDMVTSMEQVAEAYSVTETLMEEQGTVDSFGDEDICASMERFAKGSSVAEAPMEERFIEDATEVEAIEIPSGASISNVDINIPTEKFTEGSAAAKTLIEEQVIEGSLSDEDKDNSEEQVTEDYSAAVMAKEGKPNVESNVDKSVEAPINDFFTEKARNTSTGQIIGDSSIVQAMQDPIENQMVEDSLMAETIQNPIPAQDTEDSTTITSLKQPNENSSHFPTANNNRQVEITPKLLQEVQLGEIQIPAYTERKITMSRTEVTRMRSLEPDSPPNPEPDLWEQYLVHFFIIALPCVSRLITMTCIVNPFLWPVSFLYACFIYEKSRSTGFREPTSKGWSLGQAYAEYFPTKLKTEATLDPNRKYIFLYHSETKSDASLAVFAAFTAQSQLSHHIYFMAPKEEFSSPLYREILLSSKMATNTKSTILSIIKNGHSCLIPTNDNPSSIAPDLLEIASITG